MHIKSAAAITRSCIGAPVTGCRSSNTFSLATRLNRTRTGLINSVINPFTFAKGSTQVPALNFKIAEKREAR